MFSFTDAFSMGFEAIKNRFVKIFTIFTLKLACDILFFIYFFNHINSVISDLKLGDIKVTSQSTILAKLLSGDILLLILGLIICQVILTAHTITIIKNYILDTDDKLSYTFKNIWYFVGGSILLVLAIIGMALCVVIIAFIPLLGILGILGLFIGVIYFLCYYRFVPYYAFIKSTMDGCFSSTRRILTGMFWQSFGIMVIFGVINFIFNQGNQELQTNIIKGAFNDVNISTSLVTYLVIHGIVSLITYINTIVDISFISLAIKYDEAIPTKTLENATPNYDVRNFY